MANIALDLRDVQQKLLFDGIVDALKKSIDANADDDARTTAITNIENLQKADPLLRQDQTAEDISKFEWNPVEHTIEQYLEHLKVIDEPQKEILRVGDREFYNTECSRVTQQTVGERRIAVPVERKWAALARTQPNDTYAENTCILYTDTTHKQPDWFLSLKRLKELATTLHYSEAHIKSALIRLSTFFEGRIASIVLSEMNIDDGARWLMGRTGRKNIVLELYDLLRSLVRKKDVPISDMINMAKGIGYALFRKDDKPVQDSRLNKFLIHTIIVFTEGPIKDSIVNEVKRCQLEQTPLPKWQQILESTERAEVLTHRPLTDLSYNDKTDKKHGIDLFNIKINDPAPKKPGMVSNKLLSDTKPRHSHFPLTPLESNIEDRVPDLVEEPLGAYHHRDDVPDEVIQSPQKAKRSNRNRRNKPPRNPDFDRVTRSRSASVPKLHNSTANDRYKYRRDRTPSRSRNDSRGRRFSRPDSRQRSFSRNSRYSGNRSSSRNRSYSRDRRSRNGSQYSSRNTSRNGSRNTSRNGSGYNSRRGSFNRNDRSGSRNGRNSSYNRRNDRRLSGDRNRFNNDRNGRSYRNTPERRYRSNDRRNSSSNRYRSSERNRSNDRNRQSRNNNSSRPSYRNNSTTHKKSKRQKKKGSNADKKKQVNSSYNTTTEPTDHKKTENEDNSLNTMELIPYYSHTPDPYRMSDFTPLLEEI